MRALLRRWLNPFDLLVLAGAAINAVVITGLFVYWATQ